MIDFDEIIDKYLIHENKPKEIGRYYPSEIGGCIRKTWFSYKNPKEVGADLLRIFEAGNLLHEFISDAIKSEKNPDIELVKNEMPIRIEEKDFIISGRIDNLIMFKLNGEQYLVEVKSTKMLPRYANESHEMQLQLYMHATNIHKGFLLYIQKDNLKTTSFESKYDENMAQNILRRFRELHLSLKNDKMPKPEAKLSDDKRWMCSYCAYKENCDKAGN
ncbi:PD-(D/E)XK nuclease family protein [Candidatus Pacearchaeota archaeon]|nr:hypothetical protein [uncultured archaeon]MBS3073780.1 PD-(D/E)XK nuclease family protein [Candidatus Pacearchaeota archaeon]